MQITSHQDISLEVKFHVNYVLIKLGIMQFPVFVGRDLLTLDVIPENVQALILSGNKLNIKTLQLENLTDVQYLDLSFNQLKLHQEDLLELLFTHLQSLRALDLSNNYLESLQSSLFSKLHSLEYLSVSRNQISYIGKNIFNPLYRLRTIKLDHNRLRSINEDWFSSESESMRDMDLSYNSIEKLEGGDLLYLKKLERLTLANNNISYIQPNVFVDNKIRELNLASNLIPEVLNQVFEPLTQLTSLNMDNNLVKELNTYSLSNHPNLKLVSLTNMPSLRIIHQHAFHNLSQIFKVDLFQNQKLIFIDPEAFKDCSTLQVLHLHTCSLSGLDESVVIHLPFLNELSLYNNPIHCNCLATWLKHINTTLVDGDKVVCTGPHAVRMATLYQLNDSQLNAECDPLVILQTSSSLSVEFGSDVTLECVALGTKHIWWNRPGEHAFHTNTTFKKGTLALQTVQHEDQGLYTCVASLDSASTTNSATVNLQVIHSEVSLNTVAISKSFVVVQWSDAGGTCFISYGEGRNGTTKEIALSAGVNQYTIENLLPDTNYNVCLLYHSKLEQTCLSVHMLPESRSDTPRDGNSRSDSKSDGSAPSVTNSVLVAFIAMAVLVVLVILLVVTCIKLKRYKMSKIAYLRQINSHDNIKLEKCYNPTTAPLFDHEHI